MAVDLKNELYGRDFAAWAESQARLLRARRFQDLDLENVAEELDALGRSERNALASQLHRLFVHLLKWNAQPERRSRSWINSIGDARLRIERVLEDSPSLAADLPAIATREYPRARRAAARETGLELHAFPPELALTLAEALEHDRLPS